MTPLRHPAATPSLSRRSITGTEGVVGMYTYRDPVPWESIATFERCLEWVLAEGNVGDREVEEAKLVVFASIDRPTSPESKGLREFHTKLEKPDVAAKRARLLRTTRADVVEAAKTLLGPKWTAPEKAADGAYYTSTTCVVGGDKTYDSLAATEGEWTKWDKLARSA